MSDPKINPAPIEFEPEQLNVDPILRFFHYTHLPMALRAVSEPFCALADRIVRSLPRNAERTVALRKLLEAKDAAVRANIGPALWEQKKPDDQGIIETRTTGGGSDETPVPFK